MCQLFTSCCSERVCIEGGKEREGGREKEGIGSIIVGWAAYVSTYVLEMITSF